MQDKSVYTMAADSDTDLDSWISSLRKVIQSNESDKSRGEFVFLDITARIQKKKKKKKITYLDFPMYLLFICLSYFALEKIRL